MEEGQVLEIQQKVESVSAPLPGCSPITLAMLTSLAASMEVEGTGRWGPSQPWSPAPWAVRTPLGLSPRRLPAPPLHKLFGLQPTFGRKKLLPGCVGLKVGPTASRPWIGIGPGSRQALGRLLQCNSAETISRLRLESTHFLVNGLEQTRLVGPPGCLR